MDNVLKVTTSVDVSGMQSGMATFEHGGVVPDTGMALVHKGERVLTYDQTSRLEKALSSGGGTDARHLHYHAAPGETPNSIQQNTRALQRAMRDGSIKFS